MSNPDHPTANDEPTTSPAAKPRRFFPRGLFGKDKEDADLVEMASTEAPPILPEPPTGSLVQASPPATVSAAELPVTLPAMDAEQVVLPRLTLPSTQASPAAMNTSDQPSSTPGHALAQLTFSFGVASLQLTAFFRVGALELKALSNVVSLHLIAGEGTGKPFEAGVSFQIDRVELDGPRIRCLLLKPLEEVRRATPPRSNLQVDNIAVANEDTTPITVLPADQAATVVQLLGTFTVAGIDFTSGFEVGSLRLEPVAHTSRLRVALSENPDAPDPSPSFDLMEVRLSDGGQIDRVRLVPRVAGTI